jgi:hypothetical protein
MASDIQSAAFELVIGGPLVPAASETSPDSQPPASVDPLSGSSCRLMNV